MSDNQPWQGGGRTCINCGAALSPISRICASCGTLAGAPRRREPAPPVGQPADPPPPSDQSEQLEPAEPPPEPPPDEPPSSPPDQAAEPPPRMTCKSCGKELGPDARFCSQCGAAAPLLPTARFCTNCGAALIPEARFCSRCGERVLQPGAAPAFPPFPLIYEVEYPAKLSRLLIFVKWLLAIPQYIVVYALGQVSSLIAFVAWFCILFTKRYPPGLFNLVVGFNRWSANVTAYAGLQRDEYPPFSTDAGRYPVTYDIEYPEKLSRWLIWVKWFLVFPHYLVLAVLAFVALPVYLIAGFAILFTGKFPRGMFNFIVGVTRWQLRVNAYAGFMRDELPPYGLAADARPGGWRTIVISLTAGVVGVAAIIGGIVAVFALSSDTTEVPVSYRAVLEGRRSSVVGIEGTDVILLDAEDPYVPVVGVVYPAPGKRYVAFVFDVTNRDSIFTTVGRDSFQLTDTFGDGHPPRFPTALHVPTGILDKGESAEVTVVFEIDEQADPAALTYSPGFAAFSPFGERVRFLFR